MLNDCYFYIYEEKDVQKIGALCLECQRTDPEPDAWFWLGAKGYKADSKITCKKCNAIIHEDETLSQEDSRSH